MKLSRKAGIVMMASATSALLLLFDDSTFVRKSSADIEKAKIGYDCQPDQVNDPCFAKRKAAVCPTGTSNYCGEEVGVDYTSKSCILVGGNSTSCYPETQAPCGVIRSCIDDTYVMEDGKKTPCNSTYKKCVSGSGMTP